MPKRAATALPLDEGWHYAWGTASQKLPPDPASGVTWRPYRINQFSDKGDHSYLWLKIRPEQGAFSRPALLVPQYGPCQAFEIWLAGRLIYTSGVMKDAFINRHLYVKWLLTTLPADYPGKDLCFRFYSGHPGSIGFIICPYLGDYDQLFVSHISHDLDSAAIALLFILTGIAGFLLLALYYRMKNPAVLSFSMMAVSVGIYILSETAVTQLYWTDPVTFSYLHLLSLYPAMAGFFAFVEQMISKKRNFSMLRLCWQFSLLYMVIALISELAGLWHMNQSFEMAMIAYVVILPLCCIEILRAFRKGNREFRIVCAGLFINLFVGVCDFLAGLQILVPMRVLFPFSLSVLMGTMVYTLFLRYRAERRAMEMALKEAEEMRRSEEEAIAEERRRIACEIHDGIAQEMALIKLKTNIWRGLVDKKPEQMQDELNWLEDLLKKNIRDIRRCIFALRPVELDELGFDEAVRRFVRNFGQHNDIWADLSVSGDSQTLPAQLEPVFFRIIQEALNNAARHADAKVVRIGLEILPEQAARLTVTDDGTGFDTACLPAVFKNGHFGLKQMRERVEKLGGHFAVRSTKGTGTEIRVTIPLP
ncbi:hypothetical protein DENIS_1093 [Desulfonema ishimotonii]|uniref:Histidine kinase domain-containing protein n=1 Tax=Desulfonema ishimotonii TaxID=45657 RepID=A0A401FT57_9BACT|nr:sensor histidine kinase [Desulfonema ishimotonii]GBC60148.1 hypothetical protein DENIS_1093 [Desulfonema ishimotonii]